MEKLDMPKVALLSTQINFWHHFIQILLPYYYCKVVSDLPKYHQKELFWSYFVYRSILHWNPHCTLKKVATWLKMVRFLKQKQIPNWVSVLITLAPCMYLFVDRVKNKNHPSPAGQSRVFNRPGVAGAVLQTPLLPIN